jgi:predicted CopG family antitoxin
MRKKLTITFDLEVYEALHRIAGKGNISHFIENLVLRHVLEVDLEEGYRQMAQDEAYEQAANEWIEGLMVDIMD